MGPIADAPNKAWSYPPPARGVETLLRAAAYATTLSVAWTMAAGALGAGPQPAALQLIRVMALGALLPYAAAVSVRASRRTSLPADASAARRAWRLPFPAPGFRIGDRDLLLSPTPTRDTTDPLDRYAQHWPAPSPRARALKHALFPLLPTLTVFRASQVIGYGGFFGEYHLYGLSRWATNLALHWAISMTALTCWAAAWRVLAEATSLLGAWIGPRAAHRSRRGAEIAAAVAYYAGVPAALAAMFLH
jgi:hypothetical protein